MDLMTGPCSVWLAIKCILGSQTPDLCKNVIFKNQLLFNFDSSKNRITIQCFLSGACTDHRTGSGCPTLAVSAAVYWLYYATLFSGASRLCWHLDDEEKDCFLKLKRSWFLNMIFLQRSGVCDPHMHFIDNQRTQNHVQGSINQFQCIGTVPDTVI